VDRAWLNAGRAAKRSRLGRPSVPQPGRWKEPTGLVTRSNGGDNREANLDRIKILDERLWAQVPKEVITEAERAAVESPVWIALQGNGHIVAMDGPGDPEVATGDVMFIAEVSPSKG
jgi:hypothetical protein